MALVYAWEKFYLAVSTLASGNWPIQQRLGDAYTSSLIHVELEDLPEEIRGDFRSLQEELTRAEATRDEGTVAATVRQMDDYTASEVAKKIVGMYDRVTREYERTQCL